MQTAKMPIIVRLVLKIFKMGAFLAIWTQNICVFCAEFVNLHTQTKKQHLQTSKNIHAYCTVLL